MHSFLLNSYTYLNSFYPLAHPQFFVLRYNVYCHPCFYFRLDKTQQELIKTKNQLSDAQRCRYNNQKILQVREFQPTCAHSMSGFKYHPIQILNSVIHNYDFYCCFVGFETILVFQQVIACNFLRSSLQGSPRKQPKTNSTYS